MLDWPPASLDMNPIENLWSIMKRRMRLIGAVRKQEIIASFLKVWFKDEEIQEMSKKLVNSMPSRVEALLAAKGGNTKY